MPRQVSLKGFKWNGSIKKQDGKKPTMNYGVVDPVALTFYHTAKN
jgi:hypothetical protein